MSQRNSVRLTISLQPEIASGAQNVAPGRNVSRYIGELITKDLSEKGLLAPVADTALIEAAAIARASGMDPVAILRGAAMAARLTEPKAA